MKRVYIAGKLEDSACNYIKNIHNMIKYAEEVKKLGFAVFVPCLDFLMGVTFGNYEYYDYFNNSQPWLEVSDYMFVCPGWEGSKGTKKEIELANKLMVPVVYNVSELIDLK